MENRVFVEGRIERESEKAYMVAVDGCGVRSIWFPKSRTEKGTMTPSNNTGVREGVWVEGWLIDAKVNEAAAYRRRQVSLTVWNSEGNAGLAVGNA